MSGFAIFYNYLWRLDVHTHAHSPWNFNLSLLDYTIPCDTNLKEGRHMGRFAAPVLPKFAHRGVGVGLSSRHSTMVKT